MEIQMCTRTHAYTHTRARVHTHTKHTQKHITHNTRHTTHEHTKSESQICQALKSSGTEIIWHDLNAPSTGLRLKKGLPHRPPSLTLPTDSASRLLTSSGISNIFSLIFPFGRNNFTSLIRASYGGTVCGVSLVLLIRLAHISHACPALQLASHRCCPALKAKFPALSTACSLRACSRHRISSKPVSRAQTGVALAHLRLRLLPSAKPVGGPAVSLTRHEMPMHSCCWHRTARALPH